MGSIEERKKIKSSSSMRDPADDKGSDAGDLFNDNRRKVTAEITIGGQPFRCQLCILILPEGLNNK